jgi:hypothetical protein
MNRTVRSLSVVFLSLSLVSVVTAQPTQAVSPLTVPTFTVTRGANPSLAKLNFTADSRARYVVHAYFSNDNYLNGFVINSDYTPGTDASNIASPSSTAVCGNAINNITPVDPLSNSPQSYCSFVSTNRLTVRFSLVVIERSTSTALKESPKSNPVGFLHGLTDLGVEIRDRSDVAEGNLITVARALLGVSAASFGYRSSADAYATYAQVTPKINETGGLYSTRTPGGFNYKLDVKLFGGVVSSTTYFDSDYFQLVTTPFYVKKRPPRVTNVVAVPTSDGGLEVSWEYPVSDRIPETATIWVATNKLFPSAADQHVVNYPTNSVTISGTRDGNGVTPLTTGTQYFIVISARMASPDLSSGLSWSALPGVPQLPPGPPLGTFTAADGRINATWEEPYFTGGVKPTNYEIQVLAAGFSDWDQSTVATFDGSATSGSIGGLTNGTQYSVRLRASNAAGFGDWDQSTVTPVGIPTAVTSDVTDIGTTTAKIGMSLNARGGNVRVSLEYKLGSSPSVFVNASTTDSSTFSTQSVLRNLSPGASYRVRARAQGSDDNFYYGLWKTFTTTPTAVGSVVTTSTATSIGVSWATKWADMVTYTYNVWAEVNGVRVGSGCTSITSTESRGTCTITELNPGVLHDVRITATASGGDFGNGTSGATRNAIATKRLQAIVDKSGLVPKLYVGIAHLSIPSYFSADSGLAVTTTSATSTKCAVVGLQLQIKEGGTCTLTITQGGNSIFSPAEPRTVSFAIAGSQNITFSFDSMSTPRISVAPFDIARYASASSGLVVEFSSNTNDICTINGDVLTPVSVGRCEIIAIQTGNDLYMSAPQVSAAFFFAKGEQNNLFVTSTGGPFDQPLTLATSGGSGTGAVTYEIVASGNTSNCQNTAMGVKAAQPGNCIVRAIKEFDANYIIQNSLDRTLVFTKGSQTISFVQIPDTLEGTTINPSVSSSSGLTVSLQSLTGSVCSVINGSIILDQAGTCRIEASQSGSTRYNAAPDVTVTFESNSKALPQTGSLLYDRTRTYYIGDTIDFSVASSVDGQVSDIPGTFTWLAETPGILQFDSQVPGRATVIGRPNFGGMLQVMFKFTPSAGFTATHNPVLGPAALQIALTPYDPVLAAQTVPYDEPAQLLVSNVRGTGQVSYGFSPLDENLQNTSVRNSKCTISGTVVTRSEPGTCVVRAMVMSDNQYASVGVTEEFVFVKKQQHLTLENSWILEEANYATRSTTYDISTMISSSEDLSVDVSTTSDSCSISSGVLTVLAAGVCIIKFSQSGTSTVEAIVEELFSFMIGKAQQSELSLSSTSTTFGVPLSLSATGGDGSGSLSYVATDGAARGCRISNGSLLSDTAGTCLVEVIKDEDANYVRRNLSPEVVTIEKSSHTLSFSFMSLPTKGVGNAPFNISSYGQLSSGLTPTFVSGSPSICTVTGTTLTVIAAGQCIVDAEFSENENFFSVSTVTRYFTVEGTVATTAPPVVNTTAPVPTNSVPPVVNTVAPATTVSEPRGVMLARGGSKSLVASWQPPSSGESTITTYVATLSPGGKRCSVSTATCTFTGLNAALSYRVSVVAVSATMTSESGVSGSAIPNIQMKVRGRTNLRTMITAPSKGAQRWSVTGGCRITGQMFNAGAKPGTCTLTLVTAKFKTMPRSTQRVSVQIIK